MEKSSLAYRILENPVIYRAFQRIVGGNEPKIYVILQTVCERFYEEHGRKPRLLDLGCGDGRLCSRLYQFCEYIGVDYFPKYLNYAEKEYQGKGQFKQVDLSDRASCEELYKTQEWDIVVALGLMHHLPDEAVLQFKQNIFDKAVNSIVITLDPVKLKKQNPIARYIVSKDRGCFVRYLEEYKRLLSGYNYHIDNFSRIPYNHVLFFKNTNLPELF